MTDNSIPWEYRIAQNPRPASLMLSVFFGVFAIMLVSIATRREGLDALVWVLGAISFGGFAVLGVILAGYTTLRRPASITGPTKRIAPAGTVLTLCMYAVFLGLGAMALLEATERRINPQKSVPPGAFLLVGAMLIGVCIFSVVVKGHHRILVFTPDALEYERGRFFRAVLPWDSMTDLTPVCDANVANGGLGNPFKASMKNLRAGVRVIPDGSAQITGKTMYKEFGGRYGVGIDCSSYRTDPNTLINAIYLLVEHPELRPLLAQPEGAVLFEGPSWRTRARMRVGDQWDRTTDRVLSGYPPVQEIR